MKKEKKNSKSERSEAAAIMGRKGGATVVKKYGKAHMRAIGKKGGESRYAPGSDF